MSDIRNDAEMIREMAARACGRCREGSGNSAGTGSKGMRMMQRRKRKQRGNRQQGHTDDTENDAEMIREMASECIDGTENNTEWHRK